MAKWDADKLARLLELAERERRIYDQQELPDLIEWAVSEIRKRDDADQAWIKTRLEIAQDMRKGRT